MSLWEFWKVKAEKLSNYELKREIEDCLKASQSLKDLDPDKSTQYLDEALVYMNELKNRAEKSLKEVLK